MAGPIIDESAMFGKIRLCLVQKDRQLARGIEFIVLTSWAIVVGWTIILLLRVIPRRGPGNRGDR